MVAILSVEFHLTIIQSSVQVQDIHGGHWPDGVMQL